MREDIALKKLGDVCDIIGGGTPSKKREDYYGGDIPWATVRDMNFDILIETDHRITQLGLENSSANVIPKDNVVIATRVGLGKVCKLKHDTAINQDLKGIIPKKSTLTTDYLFLWFKSISEKIIEAGTGATVQGVKIPFVKNLQIPVPPLLEQKHIVAILDEAFEAIDQAKANIERNIENAEELFQSKLNEIFSQRGEGWEEMKLGDVYNFKNGLNFTKDEKNKVDGEGVLTIDVYNMYRGGLTVDLSELYRVNKEVKDNYLLKKGDILFVRSSLKKEGVAWTTYFTEHYEDVSYCGFIIRGRPKEDLNPEYSVYYCRSPRVRNELINRSVQSTITNINQKLLSDVDIRIPDKVKQAAIVKELKLFESHKNELVSNYEKRLEDLSELKKSILQEAFSGELTANEHVAA